MSGTQSALENASVGRIGEISVKIREAVRRALPTPPEQFLTVMVPGKVVTLKDYQVNDVNDPILPLKTELKQAILCDDMPTLSTLQMGPTGKSVARSYAKAISKLVSAGTTIGVDASSMSDDQKRYDQGMRILSAELPERPGKTLVELYTEKQAAYTQAVENKTKAFDGALQRAKDDPLNRTADQVREAYDKWVSENARTYRNYVQAAYMDWVITGKKEEVEYWFSVVDQDSAFSRVEQSKEVMRWAVVQDVDGSSEYQKVKLEPSDWANKCLDKIKKDTNQTQSADWYAWEITRLEKTNTMLTLLDESPPELAIDVSDAPDPSKMISGTETNLKATMQNLIAKRQAYQKALAGTDKSAADTAAREYGGAQSALNDAQKKHDEAKLAKLSFDNKNAHNQLLKGIKSGGFAQTQIEANKALIKDYMKKLEQPPDTPGSQNNAVEEVAEDVGIPRRRPLPDSTQTAQQPDFFTPITVEVSASSDTKRSETSATSFSAGGSAGWGLSSVSASVSHSEAHSEASSELANSGVKVSFECMRVDINRPWLRPELFYDEDLVPGPDVKISPGFGRLRQLMETPNPTAEMESELAMYSTFPLYPVAFLVACNVVLEISGSTSSLQTYMNSSSTSASMSVGYGPFSVSRSGSHSSGDAGSTCKSTASGCRIEIKSPQIIAWISQMVPALPRLSSNNSKALVTSDGNV